MGVISNPVETPVETCMRPVGGWAGASETRATRPSPAVRRASGMPLIILKLMGEVEGGASVGVGSMVGNRVRCISVWGVDGREGLVLDAAAICFGSIFTGGLGIKGIKTGGASIRRVSRSG